MGMAALEWLDIFDNVYRHCQWMCDEEWFVDMTSRVTDKWSNLPTVKSDWWQDNAQTLTPPNG